MSGVSETRRAKQRKRSDPLLSWLCMSAYDALITNTGISRFVQHCICNLCIV